MRSDLAAYYRKERKRQRMPCEGSSVNSANPRPESRCPISHLREECHGQGVPVRMLRILGGLRFASIPIPEGLSLLQWSGIKSNRILIIPLLNPAMAPQCPLDKLSSELKERGNPQIVSPQAEPGSAWPQFVLHSQTSSVRVQSPQCPALLPSITSLFRVQIDHSAAVFTY